MNEPLDWSECATEYARSRERITALVLSAPLSALDRHVQACPDWTARDLCAHLAGVPAALVAGDLPHGDTDAWVAGQVAARSGRDVVAVLDEWAVVSPAFEEMMASMGGRIAGLLLDAVAHEHDLRQALGAPGARDTRGVALSMGFTRLVMDGDLKRIGGGPVRMVASGGTWQAGGPESDDPVLTLDLSDRPDGTFELMRLFGSRRSRQQVAAYPWRGEWEAVESGLFHMPLPQADYIE